MDSKLLLETRPVAGQMSQNSHNVDQLVLYNVKFAYKFD